MTQDNFNKRHEDGQFLLKTLSSERSVIAKRLNPSKAANVPSSASKGIYEILEKDPTHEVYGSLAMSSRTFLQRTPNDIDIASDSPREQAEKIEAVLKKKGKKTHMDISPSQMKYGVQVKKGNKFVDAADVHATSAHLALKMYGDPIPPENIEGVYIQTANDQLQRKGYHIMRRDPFGETVGPSEHRVEKDVVDFITTSRLLIDSKELKAKAELARVKKRGGSEYKKQHAMKDLDEVKESREALESWKDYANTFEYKGDVGKDPIPAGLERKFIKHAVNNPNIDIDDIKFKSKTAFRKPKVKTEREGNISLFLPNLNEPAPKVGSKYDLGFLGFSEPMFTQKEEIGILSDNMFISKKKSKKNEPDMFGLFFG